MESLAEYPHDARAAFASAYLLPPVLRIIKAQSGVRNVFDLGCGNGTAVSLLTELGYKVTGIDISEAGINHARARCPTARLEIASVYDDLRARYGQFPVVISLEVVEHCFWPRKFAKTAFELVEPGGIAIISTPYHGYWKNLALALSGRMDAHFTALWDGGHVKFWSIKTMRELLSESGFVSVRFERVGRLPLIAKSMIAIAHKPRK